jgi:MFS family permease
LLVKDGSNIFSENFEDNLESYEIKKSANTIIHVIDLVRFTNVELFSSLKSIPSGDSVLLRARLLDSSLNRISNKTIIFEYQFNDIWIKIGESQTDYNGTSEINWKVPNDLQEHISIRAIFQGDREFTESLSKNLILQVTQTSGPKIETFIIIFSIFTLGLVGLAYLFYRLGRIKFLSILSLQIFDTQIDRIIWFLSSIIMAISWILLYTRKLLERKIITIPIISMIFSIILLLLGIDHIGSFFAFLSPILVAFTPLLIHKQRELANSINFAILFVISFLSIIFLIEVGSALGWIYNSLDPHVPFDGDPRWILPSLEANLTGILYPFALPTLIVLVFSWAWIPVLDKFYRSFIKQHIENSMEKTKNYLNSQKQEKRISRDNHYKFLTVLIIPIIILTSFFIVYYPYFYTPRLIGVDTPWYYENLLTISSSEGIQHGISDYGAVTRMPYLLILYALMTVFSLTPMLVVKIGPAIPAALMGVSSFYLTRTLTRNDFLATISAFLGLFSIATTVGIFAGVYANWLALGLVLIFWTSLLKVWQNPSRDLILITIITSFLILITHPWTWAIILASLAAYLMFNIIFHRSDNNNNPQKVTTSKSALIILGINFVLLVILLAAFSSGEFIRLSTEVLAAMSTKHLTQFVEVITYSLRFYVGGFLANTIIITLCILGLLTIKNLKKQFYRLFISLLVST